jgi:16S rRNA (cytosine967-C5)-methyltransferase
MAASPARSAAFRILLRVQKEDAFAADLLHSPLLNDLSPADRALCTQIVMGVLRWQARLDDSVQRALGSEAKFHKLDVEVLTALRIGAFQLGYLEKIPARAAIHESVELTKRARKTSAAPLVNAVLRRISSESGPWPAEADQPDAHTAAHLAEAYSHPHWLVERWVANFGYEAARAICRFDQSVPETALRLDAADWSDVEESLRSEGIRLQPGQILSSARRIIAGNIHGSKLLSKGAIAVQDEASQLVALLVGKGSRILDCCAAPGGKTSVIARRNPDAEIIAAELHSHRARIMQKRLRAKNVKVLTADATALPPSPEFDRVLADVPCSGTGTLARNPEIKWKLTPSDITDLQQRQIAILKAALERTSPGGRVVYSTCSLEPEEGREVISQVLKLETMSGVQILEARGIFEELRRSGELIWKDIDSLCSGPFVRTVPGIHPCDGFFAAVLERPSH